MIQSNPNPFKDVLRDLDTHEEGIATVTTDSRRYGKIVTIITGLEGRRDIQAILKDLKQRLAVGGALKDGRIELQGDQRRRVIAILASHDILVNP